MPIAITGRVIDGVWCHCAVFICDHCGKQIENTAHGIVDYKHVGKGEDATEFRILHNWFKDGKPGCSTFYRQQFNSVMLDDFVEQLLHNGKHKKPNRPRLL